MDISLNTLWAFYARQNKPYTKQSDSLIIRQTGCGFELRISDDERGYFVDLYSGSGERVCGSRDSVTFISREKDVCTLMSEDTGKKFKLTMPEFNECVFMTVSEIAEWKQKYGAA